MRNQDDETGERRYLMPCAVSRGVALLLLFLLAAMWGSAYMFIKIAVETIPPVSLVAVRVTLSAVALLAFLRLTGARLPVSQAVWARLLAIALSGNVLAYLFLSWGQKSIPSNVAAILLAIAPLFTVALAQLSAGGERVSRRRLAGVAVGFAGIVVLVGPGALGEVGLDAAGHLAVLAAAVGYAVSTVLAGHLRGISAPVAAAGAMTAAAVVTVPASLAVDRPWLLAPADEALLAVAILALFCTAAGQIVYFRVIALAGTTFTAMVSYLTPLVGIVCGTLFLGERIEWSALFALLLILAGLSVVRREAG